MFSISRVSLLLCLLIITVGCQKGADPSSEKQSSAPTNESAKTDSKETTSSKTETASKSADKEDPKSEEPKPPELPKTVTGNWGTHVAATTTDDAAVPVENHCTRDSQIG